MSDNANKMGTDMVNLQNAYQGLKNPLHNADNLNSDNRLAQYKPLENGGTLNVLRRKTIP